MSRHDEIPVESPDEWHGALRDAPHAFAHTWHHCAAMGSSTGLRTFLYRWDGGAGTVLCPFSVRTYGGVRDIVTPYGFSGFVARGDVAAFRSDWLQYARQNGYVCAYVQLNPLLPHGGTHESADRYAQGTVYVVDLGLTEAELFSRLSENRRRELRAAARTPHSILVGDATANRFFLENYHACMRGRGASLTYQFTRDALTALLAAPGMLTIGVADGETVESVSTFGWTRHGADYLFNVSLGAGRRYAALLIWEAVKRLKALGVPTLNLGGGVHAGDGVARFKERFGATRMDLSCVKQVLDRVAFDELCHLAGVEPDTGRGFFPPYHRPVAGQ